MTREELYARRAFMAEKGITKCDPGVALGAVDSTKQMPHKKNNSRNFSVRKQMQATRPYLVTGVGIRTNEES